MSMECGILELNCESHLALTLALASRVLALVLALKGPGLGIDLGLEGPGLEGHGLGLWILALTTSLGGTEPYLI